MAALSYNYNIFTNVHKWDEEYTYLGIQVSGKLNQYNGQNYPILDAIDIDWNGAYVKALNSYVYTTEDLIKLFNKLGEFDTNISNNLINNYYNKDQFNEIFNDYQNSIAHQFDEMTVTMEEEILQNMLSRYELLNALSSVLIDQTRYLEVPYDTLVKNHQLSNYALDRQIFTRNEQTGIFSELEDKTRILRDPNEKYYIFIMSDIIHLNDDVEDIYNIIGDEIYDDFSDTYTYTGFRERFYNIETDISYLTYYLDNNTETTITSYNYAYSSYLLSNENKEKIGYHTRYNVYEKIENRQSQEFIDYLNRNNNNIWIKDPNDDSKYISIHYSGNPEYEYYILHDMIPGTGIEKEIEDINTQIEDNSYLLYHLHTKSNNTYIDLNITPSNTLNKTIDRTITLNMTNSYVNDNTGEITYGVANQNTIINSVSYLFSWEILKK